MIEGCFDGKVGVELIKNVKEKSNESGVKKMELA